MDIEEELLKHPKVKTREEGLGFLKKIIDNFAINFFEWVNENCLFKKSLGLWVYKNKPYSTVELLQIYKSQL